MPDHAMMKHLYDLSGGRTYYKSGAGFSVGASFDLTNAVAGKCPVPVWLYIAFLGLDTFHHDPRCIA